MPDHAWDDPRVMRGMRTQFERLRERLAEGQKIAGWKVAFGVPAAMERLRIQAPLVGFLTDHAILPSGTTLSLSGWNKAVAEPEIAVHMGRDLAGGSKPDATRAAIAALGPAIELADLDLPPSPDNLETVLGGDIYQRHAILGRGDPSRAGCETQGLVGRVRRNGAEIASVSDPQAVTGELVGIVRHVAEMLAAFGETLRAGQIIITGSIVAPLMVEAGEEIVFDLEPIDTISVRFAPKAAG
jgi:2-keto-4-pentenoate hydratase